MITLVEFLQPLGKRSLTDKCLSVLYFEARYRNIEVFTASEIRQKLIDARVPNVKKANVTTLLSQAGAFVDSPGLNDKGQRVWKLTNTGAQHVREILGLSADSPEIQHDVSVLEGLVKNLKPDERDYLEEAITCLKVGALRATVVFVWAAAIRNIQTKCLRKKKTLNPTLQRHDRNAHNVTSMEDFAYIKDTTVLLACQDLKIFDKSEKETLEEALRLRNRCGHPSKYKPKEKKVSSFIEDLVSIVFK